MDTLLDALKPFVTPLAGSLVGAFAGARLAFNNQRRKTQEDRTEANRAALLKAQIVLNCHVSSLAHMRAYYSKYKGPERELKIGIVSQTFNHSYVDVASLSFLADHNKADEIMQLYIADTHYRELVSTVKDRNDYRAKFDEKITIQEFNEKTGSGKASGPASSLFMLKQITDAMYTGIDVALRRCIEASETARLLGEELFPGSKFPDSPPLFAEGLGAAPQNPTA